MVKEIVVKMLHGPFDNLTINSTIQIRNIVLRYHQSFIEGIVKYKAWDDWIDKYIDKKVYFVVIGTRNIKQVIGVIEKSFKLLENDEYIIVEYNNVCQLKRYIEFDFKIFSLDKLDVRNPNDWKELAEQCTIRYNDPEIEDKLEYNDFNFNEWLDCAPYSEDAALYIYKTIQFIQKYGDDFATYVLKHILNNNEVVKELIKIEAKNLNIKEDNIVQLYKEVCKHYAKHLI